MTDTQNPRSTHDLLVGTSLDTEEVRKIRAQTPPHVRDAIVKKAAFPRASLSLFGGGQTLAVCDICRALTAEGDRLVHRVWHWNRGDWLGGPDD